MGSTSKIHSNRLTASDDPYLLLHAHNPVDWYPWGQEAIEQARTADKPIFLSVGYSTCYWCHVAEREIYSNPDIADLMNQWFVNVKVDREQRPDVDRIYMLATQLMTGAGGWPNNVFLTPELKPFYAGSYFPPADQPGRPGFTTILRTLHRAWSEDRPEIIAMGEKTYRALQQIESESRAATPAAPAARTWSLQAVQQATRQFNAMHGGFGGGSTMFPHEPVLSLLLARAAQEHDGKALKMASAALHAMAEGGVMDQLAGGFHRYSTDPEWNVPHFEKMLYDNAQLLGLYALAYTHTSHPLFHQVAVRTAHYLMTEMHDPKGGFYSAQDAEVGGAEGASYLWTRQQIDVVLGAADAQRFFALYTLIPMPRSAAGQEQPIGGVLRVSRKRAQALAGERRLAAAIDAAQPLRARLLAERARRNQPARDEKIVVADNALAILGFVQAGAALRDATLTATALDTARWIWARAYNVHTSELKHQFFHNRAGAAGFLDDYALLGQAFLALHAVTGDVDWHTRAQQLGDAILRRFQQPDGALNTAANARDLLVAPPVEGDSTQPSGQSAAIALLLGLSVGGNGDGARYATAAARALGTLSARVATQPFGWGALLAWLGEPQMRVALDHAQPPPTTAPTPGLPNSADHVHARATLVQQLGENIGVCVAVDIDDGYHINANPASDADLIPTELTVRGVHGVTVTYPPAQTFATTFAPLGLAVYTGHLELHVSLPPIDFTPTHVELKVQACDEASCMAPATLSVPIAPAAAPATH